MQFWQETLLGTLAAVGIICIMRSVYDIICIGFLRRHDCAELYLYGDENLAQCEQMMRAAIQMKWQYVPGMTIVFIDTSGNNREILQKNGRIRTD